MCGIFGYAGSENAVPIILDGLKKLEYRGYDSAGIAVVGESGFKIKKQKGRLSALEACLAGIKLHGNIGIGHTRWATHGEPSDLNSHPHTGSKNRIAVVHNGIIENYKVLKQGLESEGVKFISETDTEVIAQLLEHFYNGNIVDAVIRLTDVLEGSYAIGVMCVDEPDKLIAIKKDNPLIIGVLNNGNVIASDVPAVLKHTSKVYYPEDMEIAVISKYNVEFYNLKKEIITKQYETIDLSLDSTEKGGYPHFMLKEIMEQPRVLRETIASAGVGGRNKKTIDSINITRFNRVVITACGSAFNAGVVGKYVFERLCRFPVETELASEFRYKDAIIDEKTLVILISQSGETADTIAAMREAKRKGAVTLSIVNVIGSTIAKESDYTIFTVAGPEIAVATTKAFSAQLAMLYILAIDFAVTLKRITKETKEILISEVIKLPEKISAVLKQDTLIKEYSSTCTDYKSIFFIGRNIDYAIALEGSLKLKEISYIHSEAYAGGELKHGTISLIEENTLVVALASCERLYQKIYNNVEQVMSRGAKVFLVGSCIEQQRDAKISTISLPEINELFSPSLSVIVLQLFSYYVALNKGLDIDKPRNLAKSVTVE